MLEFLRLSVSDFDWNSPQKVVQKITALKRFEKIDRLKKNF